ncbi:hypothetical protein BsWGS_16540 [Bradybaena similaris]
MDWQTPCGVLSRLIQYAVHNKLIRAFLILMCFIYYCEIIHYFVVQLQCTWPVSTSSDLPGDREDLRVMFIADTHLLGSRNGHWFDKLRREWQMKQAFQTSMLIHKPDAVFVLGDLFDEGKWCDDSEFNYHASRFRSMFAVPDGTQLHVLSGNHDEGFHYMMTRNKHERFAKEFDSPSVRMLQIKDISFVLVNSMAMEGDGCAICASAEQQLQEISSLLLRQQECAITMDESCKNLEGVPYTQPILLQHFPMHRLSDSECNTEDSAPPEEKNIVFRQRIDCLDQRSSNLLFTLIQPRLIISAHTHHGCYIVHPNKVSEWSVASFSWRNRNNPTFLLARLNKKNHTISQCFLPEETTVINIYIFSVFVIVASLLWPTISYKYRHKLY